jgi:hypothetical protein
MIHSIDVIQFICPQSMRSVSPYCLRLTKPHCCAAWIVDAACGFGCHPTMSITTDNPS